VVAIECHYVVDCNFESQLHSTSVRYWGEVAFAANNLIIHIWPRDN
jgi:hypothetical protein